ncbi:YdjC-like family protein [Latilactobacillus fuchuensis]|uniref:YdjC-like family protein n=1 Tax=Latilactobacillus fuchuensis TaxID=164393 RepID=A0A2N9DYB3_9LACO|nr:YdjC-like family protein [Latilactobacillus fuchuensis]
MHRQIVTCTNAQVTSADFSPSVQLARQEGVHQMGLHLVLDRDQPVSRPALIPTLIKQDGHFWDYATLQKRVAKLNLQEVRLEFQAQIDRFLASGLQLTHLTSHHFVSTLSPAIYQIVLALAEQYRVPVRNELCQLSTAAQRPFDEISRQFNVTLSSRLIMHQHTEPVLTERGLTAQLTATTAEQVPVVLTHIGWLSASLRAKSSLTTNRLVEWQTLDGLKKRGYYQRHNLDCVTYQSLMK